ncbi:MAG: hypothetical protein PHE55_00480 [Methylococcaceae bacterium]|nr:hypothetical protein [Methylococcaceae bacterium]
MKIKIAFGFMAILALIYFSPVLMQMRNSNEIHGSTTKQVKKSAMQVRRNLANRDRNAFDTAFGLLEKLKSPEGPEAFAQAVGGLSTDQVVELARKEVNAKIAGGDPDFKAYASWDDMLEKIAAEDAPKKPNAHPPAPLRQSERTGRPN